jgi:antitoxin PrlF
VPADAAEIRQLDNVRAGHYFLEKVMAPDMESALTSKGQATIPKAIREHLGLKPGGRIRFFIHPDGSVVILPELPVSRLRGMLKSRKRRPVTIEEMDEAIAAGAAEGTVRRRAR